MHAPAVLTPFRTSESELIARVLDGDRVAARELYDAHVTRVYQLAYRLTGEEGLARDCTQDAFVRAFAQLSKFRGDSAFGTWLHCITVRIVAEHMRKVKRLRTRETPLESWHWETEGSSPEVDPILRDKLHRAIDALPEIYRTAVIMYDIEGYSHGEIASILGIAEGTSKSRLALARGQLRAQLQDLKEERV